MSLHRDQLIKLSPEDSKESYLQGFWHWVERLAQDDYQGAIDGLYWPEGCRWNAASLKERVTTFFGGSAPWSVVVPNDRLIGVINDSADYQAPIQEGWGWFMAQVPVTTEPADPKDDDIPLMGLACSFFVKSFEDIRVMQFEIFHL